MPVSSESSTFVSLKARMSGKFESNKDSHPVKLGRRPWILVKLSFRELIKITFDNMAISLSQRHKSERQDMSSLK